MEFLEINWNPWGKNLIFLEKMEFLEELFSMALAMKGNELA